MKIENHGKKDLPRQKRPVFEHDEVTHEVERLVNECFAGHPGQLDLTTIPVTVAQVNTYWRWVLDECMDLFGPYEDAMSHKHSQLFHTRTSALINLHRIVPRKALADVLALDIPLNSKEGFVRQLIGWREYMHHVFDATDGLTHFPPHHATAESRNYLGAHLASRMHIGGKRQDFSVSITLSVKFCRTGILTTLIDSWCWRTGDFTRY